MFILMLGFFAINPLEMFSTDSDYAAERCESSECTCQVSLSTVAPQLIDYESIESSSVYFEEGSSQLSDEQKDRIQNHMALNPEQRYFTVTGYTDGCGGSSYNISLSRLRAQSVKRYVMSIRSSAVVSIRAVGEVSHTHHSRSRRVDIQSQRTTRAFPAYPEIRADVYLIDASGSMSSSYRYWLEAISQARPSGSRVYISYDGMCYRGQNALHIAPGGGTEIWYSYWHVIDKMRAGQTLLIISDFQSRVPLTDSERVRISQKVDRAGIRVISILP